MLVESIELLPALLVAFAGSAHCVGMCGGFVLACGGGGCVSGRGLLYHQGLYHVGKTTSYIFLGALAGLGGEAIRGAAPNLQRVFSVLVALVILAVGLHSLGWLKPSSLPRGTRFLRPVTVAFREIGVALRRLPSAFAPLFVGAFSGLLPCPLVYAFLAAGAGSGSVLRAVLLMVILGLGTIPALFLVAAGGTATTPLWRRHGPKVVGVVMILLAAYTCYRGWANAEHCSAVTGGDTHPVGKVASR